MISEPTSRKPGRNTRRLLAAGLSGAALYAGYTAGFGQRSQLFGEFPYQASAADASVQASSKRIALTFDDGPNEPYTSQLLDLLERHRVRATFFQVGRCAERFPSATRRVVEAGHLLGNHSYHHEFGRYLREPAQRTEISRAQQTLTAIAGCTPALYRPPWLCHWPWVLRSVREQALAPVSGLFAHPFEVFQPPAPVLARSAERLAAPGRVLIFHDGFDSRGGRRGATVAAVELLVPRLLERGYEFVTVAELLGVPGYLC